MKLYVCYGTWKPAPRPGGHPCGRAYHSLKDAGHSTKPVGSTAVREAIEKFEPALALHGHIHEARGSARLGNTLCINPGSSYEQGQLLGAVVELDGKKKIKRFILTSG